MMRSKLLRFTVPTSSAEYATAMANVRKTFISHVIDEGQKPLQPGQGILYVWLNADSIQTSWGPLPMIKSFQPDAVLVEPNDILGLQLLYEVMK